MSSSDSDRSAVISEEVAPTDINLDLAHLCPSREVERTVQHFGFTPKALADTIFNRALDVYDCVVPNAIEQLLRDHANITDEQERREVAYQIAKEYKKRFTDEQLIQICDKVDVHFSTKLFYIPTEIPLEGDNPQVLNIEEDMARQNYEQAKNDLLQKTYTLEKMKKLVAKQKLELDRIETENTNIEAMENIEDITS